MLLASSSCEETKRLIAGMSLGFSKSIAIDNSNMLFGLHQSTITTLPIHKNIFSMYMK